MPERADVPGDPSNGPDAQPLAMIESLSRDADGVIRVGSTRLTLNTLVAAYRQGNTPEEIARQYPAVDLADVYAGIGHYLHRREEVESVRGRLLDRRQPEGTT